MSRTIQGPIVCLICAATVISFCFALAPAHAQPPQNDDIGNATVIPAGACNFTDTVDTTGATVEATDPDPTCGNGGQDTHTVWYITTQPATCEATYQTCSSDYDTILSVWTGTPGNLTQVRCRDDKFILDPTSEITFTQQGGVTYYILAATLSGQVPGTLEFEACCDVPVGCHDIQEHYPTQGSEDGDTNVTIVADSNGCGFTDLGDTTVLFGGQPATLLSLDNTTIVCRTPAGAPGMVDLVVSNSNGVVTVANAYEYIFSGIAARTGNVGVMDGEPADVLFLNESAGDSDRVVEVGMSEEIALRIDAPPSRMRAKYALWAFCFENPSRDRFRSDFDLGDLVFAPPYGQPTPPSRGTPGEILATFNVLGRHPLLGEPSFNSQQAPTQLFRLPDGLSNPITVTFQAIIRDDGARIPEGVAISNAVVMRLQ